MSSDLTEDQTKDIINYHLKQSPEWTLKKHKSPVFYYLSVRNLTLNDKKEISSYGIGCFAGPFDCSTEEKIKKISEVLCCPMLYDKLTNLKNNPTARTFYVNVFHNGSVNNVVFATGIETEAIKDLQTKVEEEEKAEET